MLQRSKVVSCHLSVPFVTAGHELGRHSFDLYGLLNTYRINWLIRPPYMARARQMPSLRRGRIEKGDL
jgi:hypothetical protein